MSSTYSNGRILNDLEMKIDMLERTNFDLKMQLFYANQNSKMKETSSKHNDYSINSSQLSDSNSEILALKSENDRLRRKISDIESELLQTKVINDLNSPAIASNSPSIISDRLNISRISSMDTTIQIEENRRSERLAAMAVANADRSIIKHLENEVNRLTLQHNEDQDLILQCNQRISELSSNLEAREQLISDKDKDIKALKNDIRKLNERSQHQDTLFKQTNERMDQLKNNNQVLSTNNSHKNNTALDASFVHLVNNPIDLKGDSNLINSLGLGSLGHYSSNFVSDRVKDEINRYKRECLLLREQLERERSMFKSNEEILSKIRSSAEELSLLEAEEIVRLGTENERLNAELKKYRSKCNDLEIEVESCKRKLVIEKEINQNLKKSSQLAINESSHGSLHSDTVSGNDDNKSVNSVIDNRMLSIKNSKLNSSEEVREKENLINKYK